MEQMCMEQMCMAQIPHKINVFSSRRNNLSTSNALQETNKTSSTIFYHLHKHLKASTIGV